MYVSPVNKVMGPKSVLLVSIICSNFWKDYCCNDLEVRYPRPADRRRFDIFGD